MWVGNVFSLSVRLSVCLPVQAITFEPFHIGTSFLAWRYIVTIFRSHLSIKIIRSRSRPCTKNDCFLILTCYSFVRGCRSLIRSKSHIKVEVKSRSRSNHGHF